MHKLLVSFAIKINFFFLINVGIDSFYRHYWYLKYLINWQIAFLALTALAVTHGLDAKQDHKYFINNPKSSDYKLMGKSGDHRFGVELEENKQFHHTRTGSTNCNTFGDFFLSFSISRGWSQTRMLRTHSRRQKIFDELRRGRQRIQIGAKARSRHGLPARRRCAEVEKLNFVAEFCELSNNFSEKLRSIRASLRKAKSGAVRLVTFSHQAASRLFSSTTCKFRQSRRKTTSSRSPYRKRRHQFLRLRKLLKHSAHSLTAAKTIDQN